MALVKTVANKIAEYLDHSGGAWAVQRGHSRRGPHLACHVDSIPDDTSLLRVRQILYLPSEEPFGELVKCLRDDHGVYSVGTITNDSRTREIIRGLGIHPTNTEPHRRAFEHAGWRIAQRPDLTPQEAQQAEDVTLSAAITAFLGTGDVSWH